MRIVIDGDGSPVKDISIKIALKYQLPVVIVTSIDHYSNKEYPENVAFVYADKGADAADYKLVGLIKKDDIVVTQDYGLASLVLGRRVRVLHQSGKEYTQETIGNLLEQRYFGAKMRKAGQRTKGPKAFTEAERQHFAEVLTEIIKENLKKV